MIANIKIENFRGIADERVDLDRDLTILLGGNGSGKTTLIDAIQAFFTEKADRGDFGDADEEQIRITIEFAGDSGISRALGRNSATKTFKDDGSGKIICETDPPVKINWKKIAEELLIVVESSRDPADDATEGKASALSKLTKLLFPARARSPLEAELEESIRSLYARYADERLPGLADASGGISRIVSVIGDGLGIELVPSGRALDAIFSPKAEARVSVDGRPNPFGKMGQGDQRLYLYGLLQYYHDEWTSRQETKTGDRPLLIIDEPELHQHPVRQEAFYLILKGLSKAFQIIYSTHSEKFITVGDLPNIRFFKRRDGSVEIVKKDLDIIGEVAYHGKNGKIDRLLGLINKTEFKAGLFSKGVVLVEGYSDKAILETVARITDKNPASHGISVFACGGKEDVLNIRQLYDKLEIPTYLVWDLDMDKADDGSNVKIFEALGAEPVEEETVTGRYACFTNNIEDVFAGSDGVALDGYKQAITGPFKGKIQFDIKNSYMASRLVEMMYGSGNRGRLGRIEDILDEVMQAF